jgi:hypothetical protein
VRPRTATLEYSQLRHAKKNAAINKCEWAMVKGSPDSVAKSWMYRRCFGEMADLRRVTWSTFSQARNSELIDGSTMLLRFGT